MKSLFGMAERYHHGDLKEAVVQAGFNELDRSGVDDLSLRQLARSTGVSHAAPYRHFSDKEALVHEMVSRLYIDVNNQLEQIRMRNDLNIEQKIAYFLDWIDVQFCKKPARAQLLASRKGNDEVDVLRNLAQLFYTQVQDRARADEYAQIFWAALCGLILRGNVQVLNSFVFLTA